MTAKAPRNHPDAPRSKSSVTGWSIPDEEGIRFRNACPCILGS